MLEKLDIREVSPREGFQRDRIIPTEDKIRIINLIQDAGVKRLQVVSFANPKYVPHWADAEEVLDGIDWQADIIYEGLCLNRRGLERAIEHAEGGHGVSEVLFLAATTDSILEKNGLPWSVDEAMNDVLPELVDFARSAGMRTIVAISGAFGCTMEGYVAPSHVLDLLGRVVDMGADEAHIGDSTGEASPPQVLSLFSDMRQRFPDYPLTVHFHNNRGTSMANLYALVNEGFPHLTFDTAVGEVGGSPFAGGAGNISTEDTICMLHSMGVETGIDEEKILEAAKAMADLYERRLPSHTIEFGYPRWWQNHPNSV